MKLLKYKGYFGSVEASVEDGCLFGKIEFIKPLVNFEGETVPELQAAFEEAVDDYLVTCVQLGREPEKTCSGTFNIRIGPELHEAVAVSAKEDGQSLNDYVKKVLAKSVDGRMVGLRNKRVAQSKKMA